jgi:hypothetical protein
MLSSLLCRLCKQCLRLATAATTRLLVVSAVALASTSGGAMRPTLHTHTPSIITHLSSAWPLRGYIAALTDTLVLELAAAALMLTSNSSSSPLTVDSVSNGGAMLCCLSVCVLAVVYVVVTM